MKKKELHKVSDILGPAWTGWTFGRDGLLYSPYYRKGFAPGEFQLWAMMLSSRSMLLAENDQLKKEMEAMLEREFELIKQVEFYRRQLQLESRLGLALMRICN